MHVHRLIRILTWLSWLGMLACLTQAQPVSIADANKLLKSVQRNALDTNQIHALLKLSDFHINKTLNPKTSLDSALVLIEQAETISRRIGFARGLDNALFLRGKIQIKQHNISAALRMSTSLSDSNRVRLLLELGKDKLRPTNTQLANRDSAIVFFRQAELISKETGNQKWLDESQCLLGISYLLNKDWPRGKAYFMNVIQSRQRAGDKAGEIRVWLRMATTTFCDDCRENMSALEKALSLARQIGDQSQELLILMEMGYEHFQLDGGETRQAEQKAQQALAIQKAIGSRALNQAYHALAEESVYNMPGEYGYLSNAYYFMSDLSQAKGDLNQKLFYVLTVVKSAESSGLIDELDYAYFRLGNAYYGLNQFDKSLAYYKKSLAISHQKGRLFIQVGLISRMVVILLKQGKAPEALQFLQGMAREYRPFTYEDKLLIAQSFGECYNALKQYKLAERYYLESVVWSKQVAVQFQYTAWQRISQFYITNNQYAKADPYLKQLLSTNQKKIIPSQQLEIHLMRFKVDSAQGNYPAAIKHYQLYKSLTDSIFNEKKSKQITQLSIEYETQKKEQALTLREKNIALLTEQNKAHQTQRNALIGGTALLLALLGLSYNRYRLKQRSNRQLVAQQQKLQAQHYELQASQEEINQKNESLQLLLNEKEWLLKEIHHRVKNNLQVIMSLLNSQARYLMDDAALLAIRESQHRVQTMAMIHQKLYQSEGMARIDMGSYIQEVVVYLRDSYNLPPQNRFELKVEPIELDVTQAVPLGLIINEAITNALKYAFPKGHFGTISLTLHRLSPTTCELTIADNGVGLPPEYDASRSRSLGMTLIMGFSQQLDGKLVIHNKDGLRISLVFNAEE
ncbi:tetratricopeptide repeat protein [Spirosoma aureum]|uniref:histidine kinase n=1 Tax=Spirosoma aureum TaxID=2692134 RepID=A0A6G9AR98_9BACT|nr:histidine kinase dimerization/phosphoacceptor domain -containing protein [Spirosoma aureum]QIP15012.1 tetratricopeptide repeat protein [Spirosoma aureum]